MNEKKLEEIFIFSCGFVVALLISVLGYVIFSSDYIASQPIVQYDIAINRNGDVVINYWVWDEANNKFLSGLNSDIYTLDELKNIQRNYDWWGDKK